MLSFAGVIYAAKRDAVIGRRIAAYGIRNIIHFDCTPFDAARHWAYVREVRQFDAANAYPWPHKRPKPKAAEILTFGRRAA